MTILCVAYVGLDTGLCVRREYTKVTRGETGRSNTTQVIIQQLLT